MMADKISRAYGLLRHAYVIDSKEALTHLSLIRLGGDLKCLPKQTQQLCDTLLMDIEPAHLQHLAGRKLTPEQRDSMRAEIIRDRLQNIPTPDISILDNQSNQDDV